MSRIGFLSARLAATAIFLLTWVYGVTTHSAFAFDMFVKPRLSEALADFVTWHHAWFALAYVLSAATLIPVIRSRGDHSPARRVARVAGLGYVLVFGAVAAWLTSQPYLASLSGGTRAVLVVPGALVPILWLALIDHLAGEGRTAIAAGTRTTGQRVLLHATTVTALLLWVAHGTRSWFVTGASGDAAAWLAAGAWALLLDLSFAQVVYLALALAVAIAAGRARPAAWEYGLTLAFAAVALTEFLRRVVLPPLAFTPLDAAMIAAPFGAAMTLMWSGLRLTGTSARDGEGLPALLSVPALQPSVAIALVVTTNIAAAMAFDRIEAWDWAFLLQRSVALLEAAAVLGFVLALARRWTRERPWSMTALAATPLAAVIALHAVPIASGAISTAAIRDALDPQAAIDRSMAADPFARAAAAALIAREPFDVAYYRRVLDHESSNWALSPAVPEAAPSQTVTPVAPPPHVFIFAIDSLRRDYLSPYNPAVTFTPGIDRWARDGHVFLNAFTPYGGTWLAMPSLWAGRYVPRGWANIFTSINMFEPLINETGYDFVINDYTVEQYLRPETKRTFLNPYVPSVHTDLCQNLASLQAHLRRRSSTAPVFSYLAPMNVHILNTHIDDVDHAYPGFHSPYAVRLAQIDACFGDFVSFLKAQGLYDQSLLVLTSDHGDSLGEDGRWGHQFFLFPEIVRIPLIVSLPKEHRLRVTTDLGRAAFLTDVAPTLQSLVGRRLYAGDPPDSSTLYVPLGGELHSRRRQSFMLMSSYGSTYGVLRRNGRDMYLGDFRSWQEYAFRLRPDGYQQVPLTDARRRVNQAALQAQLDALERLYRRR